MSTKEEMVLIYKYKIEKQHSKNKYHAIERIQMLVDQGTFREISRAMSDYSHCSCGNGQAVPYDGVITGRGKIRGKTVYIYSQDFTVKGGTIGRRHGEKIARIIKIAIETKCPVIGIYDSGGARIDEGINALAGCGDMMHQNTLASGLIPQFSVTVGPCAGAAAYSPAITDFAFMVQHISYMFITGAEVVKNATGEICTNQELGGATIHNETSGCVHRVFHNEKDLFKALRNLVEMLPANCFDENITKNKFVQKSYVSDDCMPNDPQKPYDLKSVIDIIADDNSFFEIWDAFAASIVVGFAKVSGITLGIVANQPLELGGAITIDSSDKAARFIRFCDCFNIPIVTLVDTPGYLPGIGQEHSGIIRHGAKLLFAYSESTVPKITAVLRKAYGGAYIAMGSKHLGADYVYALPTAQIAVMGAQGAVPIYYKEELSKVSDTEEKQALLKEKLEEYKKNFMNADVALKEGFVDELIELCDLRQRIFEDIIALKSKTINTSGKKKHGNIPL